MPKTSSIQREERFQNILKAGGRLPRTVTLAPSGGKLVGSQFYTSLHLAWLLLSSTSHPGSHVFSRNPPLLTPHKVQAGCPLAPLSRPSHFILSDSLTITTSCFHPCTSTISSTHAHSFPFRSSPGYCYLFCVIPPFVLVHLHPSNILPSGGFWTCCPSSFSSFVSRDTYINNFFYFYTHDEHAKEASNQ